VKDGDSRHQIAELDHTIFDSRWLMQAKAASQVTKSLGLRISGLNRSVG
jgi:hypothetical protein